MTVSEFTKLSEQDYLCLVVEEENSYADCYWVVYKPSEVAELLVGVEIILAEPLKDPYESAVKIQSGRGS